MKWNLERRRKVYRHLWGIRMYYQFIQAEVMEMTINEWMDYILNETRKLREFPKVDKEGEKKLPAIGITTVNQLLRADNTDEKLAEISKQAY